MTQGVPTAGLIPSGARVEREVAFDFTQVRDMRLALRNPDFTTAARIEAVINRDVGARIARCSTPARCGSTSPASASTSRRG